MSGETFCPYKLIGALGHEDSKFLVKLCKRKLRDGAHVDKGGNHKQSTEIIMAMDIFKNEDLKRIYDDTPGTYKEKWAAVRLSKSTQHEEQEPCRTSSWNTSRWSYDPRQNCYYGYSKEFSGIYDFLFGEEEDLFDMAAECEDSSDSKSDDEQETRLDCGTHERDIHENDILYYNQGSESDSNSAEEGHAHPEFSNTERTSQHSKTSHKMDYTNYESSSGSDSETDCVKDYEKFENNLRTFLSGNPKAKNTKNPKALKKEQIGKKVKDAMSTMNFLVEDSGVHCKPKTTKKVEADMTSKMSKNKKTKTTRMKSGSEKIKQEPSKSSSLTDDEEDFKIKVTEFKRRMEYAKVEIVYESYDDEMKAAAVAKRIAVESKLKMAEEKLRTLEKLKRKRDKAPVFKKVFAFKKSKICF